MKNLFVIIAALLVSFSTFANDSTAVKAKKPKKVKPTFGVHSDTVYVQQLNGSAHSLYVVQGNITLSNPINSINGVNLYQETIDSTTYYIYTCTANNKTVYNYSKSKNSTNIMYDMMCFKQNLLTTKPVKKARAKKSTTKS